MLKERLEQFEFNPKPTCQFLIPTFTIFVNCVKNNLNQRKKPRLLIPNEESTIY